MNTPIILSKGATMHNQEATARAGWPEYRQDGTLKAAKILRKVEAANGLTEVHVELREGEPYHTVMVPDEVAARGEVGDALIVTLDGYIQIMAPSVFMVRFVPMVAPVEAPKDVPVKPSENRIKPGDVVRLKKTNFDTPVMIAQEYCPGNKVGCCWYDEGDRRFVEHAFHEAALEKLVPEPEKAETAAG